MFGISFGEILIIVVIGLIVVGPQRLPQTARFIGHFISRVQRQVHSVKTDIRREMDLEDLKKIHQEYEDAARQVENSVRKTADNIEQQTNFIHPHNTRAAATENASQSAQFANDKIESDKSDDSAQRTESVWPSSNTNSDSSVNATSDSTSQSNKQNDIPTESVTKPAQSASTS